MTEGRRDPRWGAPNFPWRRQKQVWSLFPAAAGVIGFVVLYLLVQPWLNASSDVSFYLALGLLTLVLGFTVYALARAIWGKRAEHRGTRAGAAATEERDDDPPDGDSKIVH